MIRRQALLAGVLLLIAAPLFAQDDEDRAGINKDRQDVETIGTWVYNDLREGISQAKKTNQPLLIVFR